jgi:glycosyltransferase involved in cell wall biosynthesis
MASGVPVIATNYSGNSMFFEDMPNLKDKCAFPVSYKLVQIEESAGPYTKGNHWAEADHNSAVQAMRKVSKNECRKSGLGRQMIKQVDDLYGLEAVGKKMKTLLIEALPRIKEKQN